MAVRRPVTFNDTGFFTEEQVTGDTLDVRGPLDMNTIYKIINLADPTLAQDAATKSYVDAVTAGIRDWKDSVRLATAAALPANTAAGAGVGKTLTADANGALTVDSVAAANGNRVLVKDEPTPADNGIYVVTDAGSAGTPYVLTRATDADGATEVTAGLSVFATEGTVNADTGWVLTTNDTIVVDTTSLAFAQFSSVVSYTFDQGLSNTGGSIKVELDTDADGQGAGAGGGSSGLEFDVNSAAGQLRAAVHATGGLERTATGLAARLNGSSLASAAGGLSVIHAPQVRDATFVSNEALTQYHPVAMSATNNQVLQGRANDTARSRIFGITLTAAGAAGVALEVVESGVIAGMLAGATAGDPYFLQATGGIGTALPSGGNQIVQVGFAKNATDFVVKIEQIVKRAA